MSINTNVPTIQGLRRTTEAARQIKGHLQPPPEFDSIRLVGKWVKKGPAVIQAQQPQHLEGGYEADGWTVWKHQGRMCERALSNGVYILMCRPKELQNTIAAINGNASRAKIIREHRGETLEGKKVEDQGMVSPGEVDLVEHGRRQEDEPLYSFNEIKPLAEASAAKATTTPKTKRK